MSLHPIIKHNLAGTGVVKSGDTIKQRVLPAPSADQATICGVNVKGDVIIGNQRAKFMVKCRTSSKA
jgi:hypothetical protein